MRAAYALIGAAAMASPVFAQDIHWLTPTGGLWSDGANWLGGNVPDATIEHAVLGVAGTYSVDVDALFTINRLTIDNAMAALRINAGAGLSLGGASPSIANQGVITVNGTGANAATALRFLADTTLAGKGAIVLNAHADSADSATLHFTGSGIDLIQGGGHTIRGAGRIYVGLENNGLVHADVPGRALELNLVRKLNNSLMTATDGATLRISTSVDQSDAGRIVADNATLLLSDADVNGGAVEALNGGIVRVSSANSHVSNLLSLRGPVVIDGGRTLFYTGSLAHDDLITVNHNGSATGAALNCQQIASFSGTGNIFLNAHPSDVRTARLVVQAISVTHSAGRLIRGAGLIDATVVNEGEIVADLAGRILAIDDRIVTNNNLIEARSGGVLRITTQINQGPQGAVRAENGVIRFDEGTIIGGALETTGSGVVRVAISSTMASVASSAAIEIANQQILSVGGITNNGVISVNEPQGQGPTILDVYTNGPITGSGSVRLNAALGAPDSARLRAVPPVLLRNGPGHSIVGVGTIFGPFVNEGVLAPGAGAALVDFLQVQGTMTCTETSLIDIELGLAAGNHYDRIIASGPVIVDGALRVTARPTFVAEGGRTYNVVVGSVRSGTFQSVELPYFEGVGYARLAYLPGAVQVRLPRCPVDWDASGTVNSQDFFDFLNSFFAGAADLNRDGETTSQDFFDFVGAFFGGCV